MRAHGWVDEHGNLRKDYGAMPAGRRTAVVLMRPWGPESWWIVGDDEEVERRRQLAIKKAS